MVYTRPSSRSRIPSGALWIGFEPISDLIRSLGDRYLGTLYIDRSDEAVEAQRVFTMLSPFGKPILWLDKNERSDAPRPHHNLFTRLHISEERMVALAVDTLVKAGHRKAIYPYSQEKKNWWQKARLERIQSYASQTTLEIVAITGSSSHSARKSASNGSKVPQNWVDELMDKVILDYESTAIIAPQAYYAYTFYNYLITAGISIPNRFSVISFDNNHRIRLLPISSIDPGLGYLGYCAFHLLYGIIPINGDQNGNLAAQAFLEDRGSIAVL